MDDLQITRNIGEMLGNATRSLSLQFDPKNVTLPPSITSFLNTNYYNKQTVFSKNEIIKNLESSNDTEIYTVLKYLVNKLGISTEIDDYENIKNEIIQLFPFIIKNINSNNLKIKRMVYILLIKFNYIEQDISLLSINAIQKSLSDKNSINRSISIRCLSSIKIPAVLPILLLSINKIIRDSSPLVRSACCISIIKCIKLDIEYNNQSLNKRDYLIEKLKDENSIVYQLSANLEILLSDNDPKVLSLAINAYYEIFNGFFDILHNKLNNLITHIEDLDSYSTSLLIEILINYSKLFFKINNEDMSIELVEFYDNKLINLMKYTSDSNILISCIKMIYKIYPFKILQKEIKIENYLIKLINKDYFNVTNDENKIEIGLNLILEFYEKNMIDFKNYQINKFIPLSNDGFKIFKLKIDIIFQMINNNNFNLIYKEIKFILNKSEFNYNFKFIVLQKMNRLIIENNNENNKLIDNDKLNLIIRFFMNKLKSEKNEILIGEYITGLRQLIQNDLISYNKILIKLVSLLYESIDDNKGIKLLNKAKSCIIWLLSEFLFNYNKFKNNESKGIKYDNENYENIDILFKFLPDLSLKLVKYFNNVEDNFIKIEILKFMSKFLIFKIKENTKITIKELINDKIFLIFNYLLLMSKFDKDIDIRDFSRLIGSILPNIIYIREIKINEEYKIEEMVLNDISLMNHLEDQIKNIDLSILIFEFDKPIGINIGNKDITNSNKNKIEYEGDLMNSLKEFIDKGISKGELNLSFEEYYKELRNEGFELKDYSKYNGSLSMSYNSREVKKDEDKRREATVVPKSTIKSSKYKLQTLDDFLGGAEN